MPIVGNEPVVKRKGHMDYIRVDNKDVAVRVWDHHSARWRLTNKGRRWAANRQTEFVISVPIEMFVILHMLVQS